MEKTPTTTANKALYQVKQVHQEGDQRINSMNKREKEIVDMMKPNSFQGMFFGLDINKKSSKMFLLSVIEHLNKEVIRLKGLSTGK